MRDKDLKVDLLNKLGTKNDDTYKKLERTTNGRAVNIYFIFSGNLT
jgi:hypothetical protein